MEIHLPPNYFVVKFTRYEIRQLREISKATDKNIPSVVEAAFERGLTELHGPIRSERTANELEG